MTSKPEIAAQFINSTGRHVFLTGKAGTGKTTFLHNLGEATHKNFVVVAPTGIAALNAKGVTIHSQFMLPFGSYLPEVPQLSSPPQSRFFSKRDLARRALNSTRKKVLRNIDLLIIDEVSMLRADILDAIDYRLRTVKGNMGQSFGGVQLLMIGDLYQLPPIVKDDEWNELSKFYEGMYFYQSQALREDGFTYIELEKVYRQQDDRFLGLLNALRNNRCTPSDLETLNSYYREDKIEEDGVITLTTHNYRADKINRDSLEKLPGPSKYYKAEIKDDFPENIYPLPESMELREGAQVMFIKNDPAGNRFYNGKLATVTNLSEDGIEVELDDGNKLRVDRYTWENVNYSVDSKTNELKEEVAGTFSQFPIKPAWAVTVHKSQGLTFDRAIIDVGQAFSPGQVYVALSRLRSLDGLILRTRISESVISSDSQVVDFTNKSKESDETLTGKLKEEQARYLETLLTKTFDFRPIIDQIQYVQGKMDGKLNFEDEEMSNALDQLHQSFAAEAVVTSKFRSQIKGLIRQGRNEKLMERIDKGSDYYQKVLSSRLRELLIHIGEVEQLSKTKAYRNLLGELDQMIGKQILQIMKAETIAQAIIDKKEIGRQREIRDRWKAIRENLLQQAQRHIERNPKNLSTKTGRKRKKARPKGETYEITYNLVNEGLNSKEIAEKRGLAKSTIEGHLARGIEEGKVRIDRFMEEGELQEIRQAFRDSEGDGMKAAYAYLDGKHSFGKLRMVMAQLRNEGSNKPDFEEEGSLRQNLDE